MESNNFQGDLADIIFRPGSLNSDPPPEVSADHWQYFDHDHHQVVDQETHEKSTSRLMRIHDNIIDDEEGGGLGGFGQPLFTSLLNSDPSLNIHQDQTTSSFFGTTATINHHHHLQQQQQQQSSARLLMQPSLGLYEDNQSQIINHNNIFSKMLQISPNTKSTTSATNSSSNSSSSAAKRSLLEASTTTTSLQISSPRNPAIKRRKSQAKKVVCIPAPTPANSRPTGEVVPSDLWAWRKYGQKPIKGSPYPRGYYRCSSSKGCSARKQVERSRTDPNMLVITYTSEHNHPWPTQRNALAGSTRSTPSQTTPKTAATEQQPLQKQQKEEEEEEEEYDHHTAAPDGFKVKDELVLQDDQAFDQEENQGINISSTTFSHHHHNHHQAGGYRPELPHEHGGGGQGDQDFFSGLGEIEVDPISMLLNQGFLAAADDHDQHQPQNTRFVNKDDDDLDPFC